jgi:hypothetical protein
MSRRRASIGFSLVCALFCSAVMAPSAFAVEETAAFTCVKKAEAGGAGFSKAHCRPADAVASGASYEHKEISSETSIPVEGNNEKVGAETTESISAAFTGVIAGIKIKITWKGMTITGGSLKIDFFPFKITLKLPHTVLHKPSIDFGLKGCQVKGEELKTNSLEATTVAKSMEIEFKPESGETIMTIEFEGSECAIAEKPMKVTGTFKAIPNGATLETTEASTKGLKFAGQQASFTSVTTLRGGENGNPIGFTTK